MSNNANVKQPIVNRGRPVKKTIAFATPTIHQPSSRKKRIQSIDGFVNEHFSGDLHAFAKHYGLVMQKVHRWKMNQALISDHAIYLNKSHLKKDMHVVFSEHSELHNPEIKLFALILEDYIRIEHDGNMTLFAQSLGTTQQQVHRWTKKADCLWAIGEVYRKQEELTPIL